MVVVAAALSSPAGCEDRSRRDLPNGTAQVLAGNTSRLPVADPLDRLARAPAETPARPPAAAPPARPPGFGMGGPGKHGRPPNPPPADPQLNNHAVGLGVFELECRLRDGAGDVGRIEPMRSWLGLTPED